MLLRLFGDRNRRGPSSRTKIIHFHYGYFMILQNKAHESTQVTQVMRQSRILCGRVLHNNFNYISQALCAL